MKKILLVGVLAYWTAALVGCGGGDPEWKIFTKRNSGLPSNYISAIAVDRQGKVCVGTWKNENEDNEILRKTCVSISVFDGRRWSVLDNRGLPQYWNSRVMQIAFDKNDGIWAALGNNLTGNLYELDGRQWRQYYPIDRRSCDMRAVVIDSNGDVWCGLSQKGLGRFDGDSWTVYNTQNSMLPSGSVDGLAFDSDSVLCVMTHIGGIARIHGDDWTVYDKKDLGLPVGQFNAIAIDTQGTIWFGTFIGLVKFSGESWDVYDDKNSSLPTNWIVDIEVDEQGIVWIGTDEGLVKFDGVESTVFTVENSPLPDNFVRCITVDNRGNKWIGTNRGLAVYREGGVILR